MKPPRLSQPGVPSTATTLSDEARAQRLAHAIVFQCLQIGTRVLSATYTVRVNIHTYIYNMYIVCIQKKTRLE